MNPRRDPFDTIPSPWPEQGKRKQERLWTCGVCGKQHCYRGHDGQLVSCGWCCSNKFHTPGGLPSE